VEWVHDAWANRAVQRLSRKQHESTVSRKTTKAAELPATGKHRIGAQDQLEEELSSKKMRTIAEARTNWVGHKRRDRTEDESALACTPGKVARPTRLTGQKRAAEPLADGNITTTDRARRALTRERLSIGTTNLEPD
jgi:hypothetical protein